ncbi:hypothetical protein [Actinomadura rudentiformis]|uniref:Uncharacterized protein n=1 Tax=Actinomadura rudentiformis TaxID=359158 RepID=A0A6H9YAI5_9ACTN|nr:hypothetical protein [Actinomadura rudentiformis]KAB2342191.1 hypothetical protein F8566_39735 [Actinomadura rudentiformis]
MKCRHCDNLNLLTRPTCAHCGEDLPSDEPSQSWTVWEIPRHERQRDPGVEWWKSLALSGAVLIVLAGGGFVTFDRWPTRQREYAPAPTEATGSPTMDPSTQVSAMGTLLQSISTSSDNLPGTLGSCSTVTSDIEPLRQLINERTTHLRQARNVQTDAIPDGESLRQALVSMLQATLDADNEYLRWAERPVCTSAGKSSTITQANDAATTAKQSFVGLWNGIATQYGQPTYSWDDL